ncbi:winged helix-turn-helix transcriptional regulator [Maribellus maritimus]|uniref:winged helix-turn-helix transcriptional regulator n=1 Tax=Maribellus maritimus TaxID=2870838 RepID=UPI001EEA0912|nr:helix-turn-helix domain-containing protein [Maribellus maritimus]MCG6188492.1 helix-turn-helix transcriptional regulator [Maribellus maritimus]
MESSKEDIKTCRHKIMAIADTMYVLGGKWKMHIIAALYFGEKRYSDLLEDIEGISGKMLSRELKEMEMNLLVSRTIKDTRPITVKYELTEYSQKLLPIIDNLADWGLKHRKEIAYKEEK